MNKKLKDIVFQYVKLIMDKRNQDFISPNSRMVF